MVGVKEEEEEKKDHHRPLLAATLVTRLAWMSWKLELFAACLWSGVSCPQTHHHHRDVAAVVTDWSHDEW